MPTIAEQLTQLEQDRDDLVDNLTTKGITGLTGDETFTELVPEVLNIPSGGGTVEVEEKDVNFYDYDGTRLYSYTAQEFANLTEMPANPEHSGLTAQGWNWSLADAKEQILLYQRLEIGQLYITSDNSTRIYMELDEGSLNPTISFYLVTAGQVTIDWGDGNTDTETTSSVYSNVNVSHSYSQKGNYIIKLITQQKIFLQGQTKSALFEHYSHLSRIKKIELGNIDLSNYALSYCTGLETITTPNNLSISASNTFEYCSSLKNIVLSSSSTTLPEKAFQFCTSLKKIQIPKSVTSIGQYCFSYCTSLQLITLPTNLVSLGQYTFPSCFNLKQINIPNVSSIPTYFMNSCSAVTKIKMSSTVSSVGSYAFMNCHSIKTYDFSNHVSIPSLGARGSLIFYGTSDRQIIVPDNLYENWKTTSNWTDVASYIVKASEANV